MGCSAGAPDGLEAAERLVDDCSDGPLVAERRHAADGKAGRVADLASFRLPDPLAQLRRIDAPIAGAEAEHGAVPVHEHEGLDDLAQLRADGVRGLLRRSGGVGELADLDLEA